MGTKCHRHLLEKAQRDPRLTLKILLHLAGSQYKKTVVDAFI